MQWYIAKKKTDRRWYAYQCDQRPKTKPGYEMKGPYKGSLECMMAANEKGRAPHDATANGAA